MNIKYLSNFWPVITIIFRLKFHLLSNYLEIKLKEIYYLVYIYLFDQIIIFGCPIYQFLEGTRNLLLTIFWNCAVKVDLKMSESRVRYGQISNNLIPEI